MGIVLIGGISCNSQSPSPATEDEFYFGADLSYVNQVQDQGGTYRNESGETTDPFELFARHGINLARFRLWHQPTWTQTVYGTSGSQQYSDLQDVTRSMRRASDQGMATLLDLHYSDFWADPGRQQIPAAWNAITEISVLADSVRDYTRNTLLSLQKEGLTPTFIQLGNEINCGMLFTDRSPEFPNCNVCEGNWAHLGILINAAIDAVRSVDQGIGIMLHVADPVNVNWWYENIMGSGNVTDFEYIGISYYPLWHTDLSYETIGSNIESFRDRFEKEVMIVETAYPWTTADADGYGNILGGRPLQAFPFSPTGQHDFLTELTQTLINAGAKGVVYWEPAWVTSDLKDPWGQGSSWDNATFFNFDGIAQPAIQFPDFQYVFPE